MDPLEPDDLPRAALLGRRLSGAVVAILGTVAYLPWALPGGLAEPRSWLALLGIPPILALGWLLGAWGFEAAWRSADTDLSDLAHEPPLRRGLRTFLRLLVRLLVAPFDLGPEHLRRERGRRLEPDPRPYAGEPDRGRLRELISDAWRLAVEHQHLHVGDLAWRLRPQPDRDPRRDLVVLGAWPEGPALGFAWMDGKDEADLWVRPVKERTRLEHELLTWLEDEAMARGAAQLTVGACDGDERRRALLRARGYAPGTGGLVQLVRALEPADGARTPALPDGYALAPVTPDDFPDLAVTVAAAFGTAPKTVATYEALFADPALREDLVLAVRAPDGAMAACVFAWLDPASHTGHVEPLGVHPDHQRRGLARALMVEVLARLRRAGARSVGLLALSSNQGARALYADLGFDLRALDRDWTRALSPSREPSS